MKTQSENDLILIQQALQDLAGFQGYQSAAVDALDRLRGERDLFEAALQDIAGNGTGCCQECGGEDAVLMQNIANLVLTERKLKI